MGGIVVDALHRLPKIDFGDKVDRLTQQVAGLIIHKHSGDVENKLSVRAGILHSVVGNDCVLAVVVVFVALLRCTLLLQLIQTLPDERKARLHVVISLFMVIWTNQ